MREVRWDLKNPIANENSCKKKTMIIAYDSQLESNLKTTGQGRDRQPRQGFARDWAFQN